MNNQIKPVDEEGEQYSTVRLFSKETGKPQTGIPRPTAPLLPVRSCRILQYSLEYVHHRCTKEDRNFAEIEYQHDKYSAVTATMAV